MATELLTADAPSAAAFGTSQWGIFDENGAEILAVDAVADIDYARDYRISDYPQEKGAFQSYNKVKIPFQVKIGFYISTTRQSFMDAVEKKVELLDLVTVVTPEIRYASANLTHYGYRRDVRSGVTMIRVEVWCQEVRIVAGSSSVPSATQSTNAAEPQENGQVQPKPAVEPDPDSTQFSSIPGPSSGSSGGAGEPDSSFSISAPDSFNPPVVPPK